MFKVIYTKTLDTASDVAAESWEFRDKDDAITLFNGRVRGLVEEVQANPLLDATISVSRGKAFANVEGTRYCVAVVDDMNNPIL